MLYIFDGFNSFR